MKQVLFENFEIILVVGSVKVVMKDIGVFF